MRLVSMRPNVFNFDDGLPQFSLKGCSRVVILAGPNGSGKTRLLDRILRSNGHQPSEDARSLGFDFVGQGKTEYVSVARYSAQSAELKDPEKMVRHWMATAAKEATALGMGKLDEVCVAYINSLQQRRWEATHIDFQSDPALSGQVRQAYEDFDRTVSQLLGVRLGRDPDGRTTLFGKPIADARLSDGQKALLIWATALQAQGVALGRAILLMDEPESHLHPDAALEVVSRTIEANAQGQVWIATHSLPLIAGLTSSYPDEASLFFMSEGKATYAGREPEKVIHSLMGGERNVHAMREFLDLPEILAANRFAAECLLPPTVVDGAYPADPQVGLVNKSLLECGTDGKVLKVLDFGSGDGRLLESLEAIHGEALRTKLDYIAWDIPEAKAERCEVALRRAYGDAKRRRYTDRDQLSGDHPGSPFDAVVMCNVLHEIDPKAWLSLFSDTGLLACALAPQGKLVIVEDYLMPKGEHAHPYGFIVLDTEALGVLFGVTTGPVAIERLNAEGRHAGRIRAHIVPRHLLKNVTADTRREALKRALAKAREQIHQLRSQATRDFRSGQSHAFWVQQFANVSLALQDLG